MSREDPQLRIRLPIELKEKIDMSAKKCGRSMNAEIVLRLDASFLSKVPTDDLISAKDALQIARKAKNELSGVIFKKALYEINRKIRLGHTTISVDLDDLELDGLNESDFFSVLNPTLDSLKALGYTIPETMLDSDGFMVEIPQKDNH